MIPHTDPGALLKLADELETIVDRIDVDCDWRLSSEERESVARAGSAIRQAASQGSAGGETAIEWIARTQAPFHDALIKYPDAFEALHFLWNSIPDAALSPPVKTGGEAQASNGGTTYSTIGRNADGIEVYKRDARPVDATVAQAARNDIGILLSALRQFEEAVGETFDDEGGDIAAIERDYKASSVPSADREAGK